MKLVVSVILCGWVSLAAAQPGSAPPPPPPPAGGYAQPASGYTDPGAQRHDGFYLRMFLGPGFTSMKLPDADVEVSGTGGAFGIAAGAAVTENVIVFGEVFDDIAVNPDLKMNGQTIGQGSNLNAGSVGVGLGLAYYIMPANVYVSGSLTYTRLTVQQDGDEIGRSDFGPGVSLMVGKEWWVSNNWGVGVALQLFTGRMKDNEAQGAPTWETTAAALAFSATYN